MSPMPIVLPVLLIKTGLAHKLSINSQILPDPFEKNKGTESKLGWGAVMAFIDDYRSYLMVC